MTDDANFVGGRLRLAAFLRVVENDMPQRPSRFKRRSRVQDLAHESDPAQMSPVTKVAISDVSKQDRSPQATPVDSAVGAAKSGTEYGLPRSQSTTDVDSARYDEGDTACTKGQHTSAKPKKRTKSTKQVARVTKLKEGSSVPRKSSDTRKRRLPVNSLALLRTTTSDGLPEPGDAHEAFAMTITETDPIVDSQVHLPCAGNVPAQRSQRHSKSASAQHAILSNDRRSQSRNSYSVARPRQFAPISQSHLALVKRKQRHHVGFHFVADGFNASELKTIPTRKPRRQGRIAPRQNKPKTVGSGLALVSGLLPAPVIQCADHSFTPDHMTARQSSRSYASLCNALSTTDNDLRKSGLAATLAAGGREVQRRLTDHSERAIRGQLASITAPIRRDTESSDSEICTAGFSVVYDEDEDDDDDEGLYTTPCSDSRTGPRRRPTFVEDHRYFSQAMHHLDADEDGETLDNNFCWQYNGMD